MDKFYIRKFLAYFWAWRNLLLTVFIPLILLPLIFGFENRPDLQRPMKCAYVSAIMVLFWSFECIPIAITALLPMLLYPLLGIVKAADLAPKYMDETNMAFLASAIAIRAFEIAGLHKRLALGVLKLAGIQQRWILLGFMLVAWFLSMWMQNTMTTVLLVPIVLQVSDELTVAVSLRLQTQHDRRTSFAAIIAERKSAVAVISPAVSLETLSPDILNRRYKHMLLIAVAYSSSIGGIATLLGTSPNLMMKRLIDEAYELRGCKSPLTFFSWMVYGLPTSFIFLLLGWLWLLIYFCGPAYTFGCRRSALDEHKNHVDSAVKEMYKALPPLGFHQWVVLIDVLAMVFLMVTRQLNNYPLTGWEVLSPSFVKESTAILIVVIVLFSFPLSLPKRDRQGQWALPKTALTWADTEKAIPVEIILVIGGGMAAAYGAEASTLAKLLSKWLHQWTMPLSNLAAVCVLTAFVVLVTEVMSNTACVLLTMPILRELAEMRKSNPLFFMFPSIIGSSFAFMFPVGTPPNSVIFSAGKVHILDMMAAGFGMNVIGFGVIMLATTTYGRVYFEFDEKPWNMTTFSNGTVIYQCH